MKRKSLFKFFAIVLCIIVIFFILLERSSIVVLKVGESKYKAKIMAFSYEAIDYSLSNKKELSDLILLEKDSSNNISFISTNAYKVNSLAISVAKKYKEIVQKEFDNGVEIPLGAFSGIDIFSGYGKTISAKLITISQVKCDFISNFEEMGINQTRQTLLLNVKATAEIVCQYKSKKVESEISVILFDNLIVGKVPNAYLNGKILGSGVS